jgi:hypothetical protein
MGRYEFYNDIYDYEDEEITVWSFIQTGKRCVDKIKVIFEKCFVLCKVCDKSILLDRRTFQTGTPGKEFGSKNF